MVTRDSGLQESGVQESGVIETQLLDGLTLIASRAAAAILAARAPNMSWREKPDKSPVTAADEASEAVIFEGLAQIMPGIPVLSEEARGNKDSADFGKRFFVIDPLDGTREFLAGRDEFTVNIALIDDHVPIAGIVAAPARGLIWRGVVGQGAERLVLAPGSSPDAARERAAIRTRACPATGARVLVSRSHLDAATAAYVHRLTQPQQIACGSALKFGLLAEGSADLYPRLSPTSEWDVAAGHALLVAAGGNTTKPDGGQLQYGLPDFRIPGFIAFGDLGQQPAP
jgi:3'(2'), 5'-bisphosphate nucleotidase